MLFNFDKATIRVIENIVLKDIHWTVQSNEHWAVVGETGAGKSILLEAITKKHFVLKGKFTTTLQPKEVELVAKDYSFNRIIQSSAQFYQQRFNMDAAEESPTLREILTDQLKPIGTVNMASVELPPPSVSEAELEATAEMLGIKYLLDRRLISLSNGETRRTFLAKSFLKKPKLLLLDNPFSGIDANGRVLLHDIINKMAASGIQIILVTNPNEMPSCITHILELKEGEITQQCPKNQYVSQITKDKITQNILVKTIHTKHLLQSADQDFKYALKMKDIEIQYKGVKVLDKVNWKVKKGEKWALLGENGSGKSTLLSLILGDNPQSYSNEYWLFDKKRGSGESIWDLKKRIGFVSPEFHLYFPKKTKVYQCVASGIFNTNGLYQKLDDDEKALALDYLKLLNIIPLYNKEFSEISSGEQRQVLLARALIKNPPLLILDEPCQGLDRDKMLYFRDLVNEIAVELDKTLIYVSHYQEEIPQCVHKILKLNKGKVII